MIVRILGEGQCELAEGDLDGLNVLDDEVQAAVEADDEARFSAALSELLARVRQLGRPLPDDSLVPSDLVLPPGDSSLTEVREILADDGLIPG